MNAKQRRNKNRIEKREMKLVQKIGNVALQDIHANLHPHQRDVLKWLKEMTTPEMRDIKFLSPSMEQFQSKSRITRNIREHSDVPTLIISPMPYDVFVGRMTRLKERNTQAVEGFIMLEDFDKMTISDVPPAPPYAFRFPKASDFEFRFPKAADFEPLAVETGA